MRSRKGSSVHAKTEIPIGGASPAVYYRQERHVVEQDVGPILQETFDPCAGLRPRNRGPFRPRQPLGGDLRSGIPVMELDPHGRIPCEAPLI